jgi:hypothetical protein
MSDITTDNHQLCYIGSLDISGANTLTNSICSILGGVWLLKRVVMHVTTVVAGATSSILTVKWRPVIGSDTGASTIGTITFPAAADEREAYADMYESAGTGPTTLTAASQATVGGLGGIFTYQGALEKYCGPAGEIAIVSDGGGDTGVISIWFDIWTQPFGDRTVASTKMTSTVT